MPSGAVGVWLVAQMIIEVLLCGIIIYYVLREKGSREEKREEEKKQRC